MLMLLSSSMALATIHQVGSYSSDVLTMEDICIRGDLAYVTDDWLGSPTGFIILNISNPHNPWLVGTGTATDRRYGIDVYNNRAYIGAGGIGFEVWDVSVPAAPVRITVINSGYCEQLRAVDGRLYVASQNEGLKVYDISQATPAYLGGSTSINAYDVVVQDGLAYVACQDPGLVIVDVSGTAAYPVVGSYDAYLMKSVCLANDILFLSDGHNDHLLFDVSDPSNPTFLAEIPVIWLSPSAFYNNYLFTMANSPGTGNKELKIYDVTNPSQPVQYTSCIFTSSVDDIAISGTYMYATVGSNTLLIYDISDLSNPLLICTTHIPGDAMHVKLRGDYAYVCDDGSSLVQIDISDPANPRQVSRYTLPSYLADIELDGNLAYVCAGEDGLKVFLITEDDPPQDTNFHLLGALDTDYAAYEIVVSEGLAYMANGDNLLVLDVSDPPYPTVISTFTNNNLSTYTLLDKYRNYIFVTGWMDPLSVIDVADPSNPTLVAWASNPSLANGIAIRGNHLVQGNYQVPARIYDITNSISPMLVGTLPNPDASTMLPFQYEGYIFVSSLDTNTIRCYDISVPSNPVLVWNYQWNLPTYDLFYRDGLLYTCNGEFGFSILHCNLASPNDDPHATPAALITSSHPNPFADKATISFRLEEGTSTEVTICNIKGELLRRLYNGYAKAGTNTVTWDGTDAKGQVMPSGVYLYSVVAGNKKAVNKLVRM